MKQLKIYLETTIFNYYLDTDREAHGATVKLFNEIRSRKYKAYTSIYVLEELEKHSEPKRSRMIKLIKEFNIVLIKQSDEAERLADKYIEYKIIPANYKLDAVHISLSSINYLDYIISLNFQHINKLKTKNMTEIINIQEGYKGIIICTPMEVIEDE